MQVTSAQQRGAVTPTPTSEKEGERVKEAHSYAQTQLHPPLVVPGSQSYLFHSIVHPFFFSIKAFPKQTADPTSIMEHSVSPYLTYREACPAVTFQMNNTQREGEEMKGTRDRMEVEKRGERYRVQ